MCNNIIAIKNRWRILMRFSNILFLVTALLLSCLLTGCGGGGGGSAVVDTVKPVITHTPIGNTPKASWPVTVSATVTDNIGVDSAWVRWYKNNPATGIKQFKLINTAGSNYSAAFNSLNSDVVLGDYIYYKIIAQDNSSNHNRDSSALFNFKIISIKLFFLAIFTETIFILSWIALISEVLT